MYTSIHSNNVKVQQIIILQQIGCATDSCAKVQQIMHMLAWSVIERVIESQILSQSRTQTQVRRISRFPSHTDLLLKVVVFLTQSYFMAFEDFLYAAQTCMFSLWYFCTLWCLSGLLIWMKKAFFRIEKRKSYRFDAAWGWESLFYFQTVPLSVLLLLENLISEVLSDLSCLISCIRFNVIDWFICVGRQSLQRRRSIPALTLILVQLRATWITWC